MIQSNVLSQLLQALVGNQTNRSSIKTRMFPASISQFCDSCVCLRRPLFENGWLKMKKADKDTTGLTLAPKIPLVASDCDPIPCVGSNKT